jgi:hypothetical protein
MRSRSSINPCISPTHPSLFHAPTTTYKNKSATHSVVVVVVVVVDGVSDVIIIESSTIVIATRGAERALEHERSS